MIEFRTSGMARRLAAASVDVLAGLAVVTFCYAIGWLDSAPFRVESGWFWTEWWLRHWLEDPRIFTDPLVTLVLADWAWVSAWQLATRRTPGDRLVGQELLDRDGDDPARWRLVVRSLAMLLVPLTLGLTWLWCFVSPARRTLHDVLSGTYLVTVE